MALSEYIKKTQQAEALKHVREFHANETSESARYENVNPKYAGLLVELKNESAEKRAEQLALVKTR